MSDVADTIETINAMHCLIKCLSPGHTTPAPSVHGSGDEDSVDEETELKELGIK